MAYKIEIIGSTLQITDTIAVKIVLARPKKDYFFNNEQLRDRQRVELYDTNSVSITDSVNFSEPLAECTDSLGVTFTDATFRAFISANFSLASGSEAMLLNRILVTQKNVADTLGGVIDSTKEYFIDGVIDMSGIEIEVPIGGIRIAGYGFDLSTLSSSASNETLFVSPIGGSGGVILSGLSISMNGTNSKVYDLVDGTGFNVIEVGIVNYVFCTSLGELNGYRQGLEDNTGRLGGTPELCLSGAWLGGFRITTSITRGLYDAWTGTMFKAGTGFVMQSRFLTDMNCDLGTLNSFLDFSDTNFPNPSSLELRDVLMTRDGVISANDANISPNIEASNLSCSWKGNNGVSNTFVGGVSTVTIEVQTTLTQNVPSVLLGTFTTNDLQHFDAPLNGQLRHLGNNPREYTVNFDFVLDGGQNREYKIELVKNSTVVYQQTRVVNNLQGGRDVAYFTGLANIILNKNEYVFWQVTNLSNNNNCTLELDSAYSVFER